MTNIRLSELEVIFKRILDKLRFEEAGDINIEDDFYRFIPTDEWTSYNDVIETGSLDDDVENLKKLLDDDRPCTFVDFDRLASVLRYLSQKMNPPLV